MIVTFVGVELATELLLAQEAVEHLAKEKETAQKAHQRTADELQCKLA